MSAPPLVDTHCHFDLFPDPRATLREAERNGIYSIAVTNTPSVFEPMQRLARGLKYVRPALGLHPGLAIARAAELPIFARLITETKYVGEVGLDYKVAVKDSERAKQRSIFQRILEHCAETGGRILTIHSRRAEADVVGALQDIQPGPFILHWYSGSLRNLRGAAEAGAFFSVNTAMVRSERGRRLIQELPRNRVLTESDGPFVEVEGQPGSPLSVRETSRQLAEMWGLDVLEARAALHRNFQLLLNALPVASNQGVIPE
jgi:TatD DNase family protein